MKELMEEYLEVAVETIVMSLFVLTLLSVTVSFLAI